MACPLAAAAFALTLHTALSRTHEQLTNATPNTFTTAYMDDINIITHHSNIQNALDHLRHLCSQMDAPVIGGIGFGFFLMQW